MSFISVEDELKNLTVMIGRNECSWWQGDTRLVLQVCIKTSYRDKGEENIALLRRLEFRFAFVVGTRM